MKKCFKTLAIFALTLFLFACQANESTDSADSSSDAKSAVEVGDLPEGAIRLPDGSVDAKPTPAEEKKLEETQKKILSYNDIVVSRDSKECATLPEEYLQKDCRSAIDEILKREEKERADVKVSEEE